MNRRSWCLAASLIFLSAAGLLVLPRAMRDDSGALHSSTDGQAMASVGAEAPPEMPQTDPPPVPSEDPNFLEWIQDELIADLLQKADTLSRYPIHPGRAALQELMRAETTAETFEHVADNDNLRMLAPDMGSIPFTPGCYPADVRIVTRLTRVRKLLADSVEAPADETSRFYQDQLGALSESFPAACEEFQQTLRAKGGKVRLTELPDVEKQRLQSTIAVYVLSEIGAYDALPLMAKLSTQGKPNLSRPFLPGGCQVNPLFLLYSMHRLVKSFPEANLTSKARQARLNYLSRTAAMGIPDAQPVKVPSWEATYDENDYRSRLPGGLVAPRDQPTVALTMYPTLRQLSGGEVQELLRELRTFVRQAFPAS